MHATYTVEQILGKYNLFVYKTKATYTLYNICQTVLGVHECLLS